MVKCSVWISLTLPPLLVTFCERGDLQAKTNYQLHSHKSLTMQSHKIVTQFLQAAAGSVLSTIARDHLCPIQLAQRPSHSTNTTVCSYKQQTVTVKVLLLFNSLTQQYGLPRVTNEQSVCLHIKTEIWQSKFYQQSCMILQVAHEWGAPSFKDVFSDRVRSALIP